MSPRERLDQLHAQHVAIERDGPRQVGDREQGVLRRVGFDPQQSGHHMTDERVGDFGVLAIPLVDDVLEPAPAFLHAMVGQEDAG